MFAHDSVPPHQQGRCASSAGGWRWASWASWMVWRGWSELSVGCNLLDGCGALTQHFPLWTCLGHWSPADSPSSSPTILNKSNKTRLQYLGEGQKKLSTLYHNNYQGIIQLDSSSGGVTSGACVSQRTADFILDRRHAGYHQHVGHWTETIIRGQATLFLRTPRACRRGHSYACTNVHWAPALPPTHLFVSTNPGRHTVTTVQHGPQILMLSKGSDTWSWCSSEFAKDKEVWTPVRHRRHSPPV